MNCHCSFCRKAHGGAFTTLLFIPLANLKITKGNELLNSFHVKGLDADRCFSSCCGTRQYNSLPSLESASIVVAAPTTAQKYAL